MNIQQRTSTTRFRRAPALAAAAVIAGLCLALTPQVLATDIADIGFVDQQALGNLSAFTAAKTQFGQIQAQLQSQYQSQIKGKNAADQQKIAQVFQGRLAAYQHQLFDPLIGRANAAIAQVAANRNLSVVVDKSIVIYGGLDITKDVTDLLAEPGQIVPPVNTPPPSEIGFVDQAQIDALPKMKAASDKFVQFQTQLRSQLASQINQSTPADQRQKIAQSYQQQINAERTSVLQPLIDESQKAIASVAKKRGLLLVVNAESRVYGGTDVTADVVQALK
jgi:outer membrane protein